MHTRMCFAGRRECVCAKRNRKLFGEERAVYAGFPRGELIGVVALYDIKTTVRKAFHLLGFDLRYFKDSEEGILRNLIGRLHPVAVLDVGANIGPYGSMLRGVGYGGVIISFEPLSSAHEKLSVEAGTDSNWIVAPRAALGSAKG